MTPEYDQNIDRIIYLLATKATGKLNAEELKELEAWKDIAPINRETADEVSVTGFTADLLNNWKQEKADYSLGRVKQQIKRKNLRVLFPRIAAAAAVLLVVGLGVFFYINSSHHVILNSVQNLGLAGNDIKPGGNKAYLVLSNGKRVSLTDAANGELAKEAGVEITKTADGQVVYKTASDISGRINGRHPELDSGSRTNYSNALNTIETPRGGQYQIRLPDGSKVWLNAASKLIYPVSFNGRGQRVVELSGEAYFEIFKNKLQPFVVKSKNQEVTVLGTHFNVNSYTDEGSVKTTLLEGSVKVNNAVLKPGEQATLANNQLKVAEVNTAEVVAWKNGDFVFKTQDFRTIMRQIARWYDVDIIYDPSAPADVPLGGQISRSKNISAILKIIEATGDVHFKIEGRRITVTK
ncbi:FecR family protein [Pedobacter sp.]|jgi:transmembrane sensor|uniref:FecR family protein n=1 Tax=Pedobacter sp. TaxID=1411316 RepID=UPI002C1C01D9|nr:FecR domain-containing protein [Pedobacter sp.]HWW42269.1 FecR domain-containing protein [Pedobacter sp.]